MFYGLLQSYSAHTALGGLQQAWTLTNEVAFYLLLPLWAFGAQPAVAPAGTPAGAGRRARSPWAWRRPARWRSATGSTPSTPATSRSDRSTPASTGSRPTSTCSCRAWRWRCCSSGPAGATSRCGCSSGRAATRWRAGRWPPRASGRCRPSSASASRSAPPTPPSRWSRSCSTRASGFRRLAGGARRCHASAFAGLAGHAPDGGPRRPVVRHLPVARGGYRHLPRHARPHRVHRVDARRAAGHDRGQRGDRRGLLRAGRAAGADAEGPAATPVRRLAARRPARRRARARVAAR